MFGCKCRAKWLHVQKDETVKHGEWRKEVYGTDRSITVTYHLYCTKCDKKHDIKYAKIEDKNTMSNGENNE